jgi:hypothetical protein
LAKKAKKTRKAKKATGGKRPARRAARAARPPAEGETPPRAGPAPDDLQDLAETIVPEQTWREVIFETFGHRRFTQDSPVMPDVWLKYAKAARGVPVDVILTPTTGHAPGDVARQIERRLRSFHDAATDADFLPIRTRAKIAYSRSSVAANLTFDELISVVVPMTSWWQSLPRDLRAFDKVEDRLSELRHQGEAFRNLINTSEKWEYFRFIVLAGFVGDWRDDPKAGLTAEELKTGSRGFDTIRRVAERFLAVLQGFANISGGEEHRIWSISINRTTRLALMQSRAAIKADAVENVFRISARDIAWAVIDAGIDATHPAFVDRTKLKEVPPGTDIPPGQSRIRKTYDFTFLRTLLALQSDTFRDASGEEVTLSSNQKLELEDFRRRVGLGREIDWDALLPLITIAHDKGYRKPAHEHGTHVAGILAGDWREGADDSGPLTGICPDLTLYDFRVFDQFGTTEEFVIMAAVQVVAHLNRFRKNPVIHGVNLSLSMQHEVMSYACGRTPICDECTRLVGDGVVVVTAAGNQGYNQLASTGGGDFGSYRAASITDPGNADAVITVGSTHRSEPHTYGVSYFSSRGPTGDGRRKPDLVAPGEKITAPIPNRGAKRMDGTSMAAPHVSGAAALLMARHRELIGRPGLIKQILCKSATDLGREVNFQGAGMLDILRALQSV